MISGTTGYSQILFYAYFHSEMFEVCVNYWKQCHHLRSNSSTRPLRSKCTSVLEAELLISFCSNRYNKNEQLPFRLIRPVSCSDCRAGRVAYLSFEMERGNLELKTLHCCSFFVLLWIFNVIFYSLRPILQTKYFVIFVVLRANVVTEWYFVLL